MRQVSTVGGISKKLNELLDVDGIKFVRFLLENSELAQQAIAEALEHKDNVDFELFWDAYGYKRGSKEACKRAWNKIKYSDQMRIIEVEIPKYKRFLQLTGIFKAQPTTYLNGKRYNDDIPTKEVWEGLIVKVLDYFDYRKWRWPHGGRPSVKSLSSAAERLVYQNPTITAVQLCGLVEYKIKTTPAGHRDTVTPLSIFNLDRNRLATMLMNADSYIRDLEVLIENSKALKKLSEKSSQEINSDEEE
jgi:hypothetical protein